MDRTLAKRSAFMQLKYKFFINRIVIYFSFLLVPIWIQQTQRVNFLVQALVMLVYMSFMAGQWYLLGKEIDHRLKIYYRVNSSMDRTLYRMFLGSMMMLVLFNFIVILPDFTIKYAFWVFFIALGIFYSWPTRGKIIEDSMTHQFSEFKFLDSFERTILLLGTFIFFISLPELPMFENTDALKIYLDPKESVHDLLWNYLSVLYVPFNNYPKLYNLIWSFHFYFYGMVFFLLAFYGVLRHFFTRRLAILGVFSILSTWSFSRILGADFFSSTTTTASLIWLWSLMWCKHSGTYRSGLFSGLVAAYLTMISPVNAIFLIVSLFLFYFKFLNDKTLWYRKQWIKYNLLGFILCTVIVISKGVTIDFAVLANFKVLVANVSELMYRKAFFVIAPIGLVMSLILFFRKEALNAVNFAKAQFEELFYVVVTIFFIGVFITPTVFNGFSFVWILALFALVPLEWIFQSMTRLRSKRNVIYAMYILVCLLDSHLENRVRIISKMFFDEEVLKYLIQY